MAQAGNPNDKGPLEPLQSDWLVRKENRTRTAEDGRARPSARRRPQPAKRPGALGARSGWMPAVESAPLYVTIRNEQVRANSKHAHQIVGFLREK